MAAPLGARVPASAPSALLDVFHQVEFRPARGEGPYLFTERGERYLDLYGGHAVALLGYGHPRLLAALEEQSRTLLFQSSLFPLPVRERAAAPTRTWSASCRRSSWRTSTSTRSSTP